MKRFTFLCVFVILFFVTILYRTKVDASAHPTPIASPMADALADPWLDPITEAKRTNALLTKLVKKASKKVLSRLTNTRTMALGQAAGNHIMEEIFTSNKKNGR
ncbi:hypothetical protein KPH14_011145 [Odynerus spinipes]|uniref:Uncharacterized protein n=1 Tax=Odynerus spinipes TaxID=1348599 RepID=A0AAD9RFR2_9HYME|nr:hypothetical protein KPH14_011145 [Odynerus spinipes]